MVVVEELANLLTVFGGEFGWLITTIVLLYEIGWPDNIGPFKMWDTKLQKIFRRHQKKLDAILQTQTHHIQVTRAITKQVDGVSEIKADHYLRENGVDVDTFIIDDSDNDDRNN